MFTIIDMGVGLALVLVLIIPFIVGALSLKPMTGLALSLVLISVGTVFWYGLKDYSFDLKVMWLGVDLDQLTFTEQVATVPLDTRDFARGMLESRMGIGWQLSAIFATALLAVPYALVTYPATYAVKLSIRRYRKKCRNVE